MNRQMDIGKHICNCNDGLYSDINNSCSCKICINIVECSPICKTCSDYNSCTSCYSYQDRYLVTFSCQCLAGFYELADACLSIQINYFI
jgi:hypothetical protein